MNKAKDLLCVITLPEETHFEENNKSDNEFPKDSLSSPNVIFIQKNNV